MQNLTRLNKPQFVGRRWSWVDPVSDVEASIKAVDNNLTTLQEELAKSGRDYEGNC
jgi:capsid protein